jgi:transcription initiation factor TFIIIB Brf1 subunit/transcription initiation factor TFIIB
MKCPKCESKMRPVHYWSPDGDFWYCPTPGCGHEEKLKDDEKDD